MIQAGELLKKIFSSLKEYLVYLKGSTKMLYFFRIESSLIDVINVLYFFFVFKRKSTPRTFEVSLKVRKADQFFLTVSEVV